MILAPFSTVRARNGMVCAVDHLAASAGVSLLRAGGSAADAAVAASAVLAVTTQHLCGMGGDLFALVHHTDGEPPAALDASGRAGSGSDADALRAEGHRTMPFSGDVRSVTVPGCVDGWLELHRRFGRRPVAEVLAPAVDLAENGFPAPVLLVASIARIREVDGADDYTAGPVRPGTLIRRPRVAAALRAIVEHGRDGHYGGAFGAGLIRVGDGLFTAADLERVQAGWVEPAAVDVWDHRVFTTPPASQGYLTLAGAVIAELIGIGVSGPDPTSAEWAHAMVEAARLAGYDRPTVLHEGAVAGELLDTARLAARAAEFDPTRVSPRPAPAATGDTIYLCAADGDGMGVSLIQSNASGWGVGLTVPECGIFLHNRGIGFSLEPGHPAELGPGRRPPHTLSPALVQRPDGTLRAVLGTMGGDTQPQVVLQLLARLLVHGQDPAECIASPRWRVGRGGFDTWTGADDGVGFEDGAPDDWEPGLRERGHAVHRAAAWNSTFGHAHLIERDEHGVLAGASDPRALDGAAVGW